MTNLMRQPTAYPLVSKNDRYGFMNQKGEITISMKYTNAVSFSEGIAAVALDTNWFFIDVTGKQLFFRLFYDVPSFKDSLCAVTKDRDTWGYIDRTGIYAIPAGYSEADDFDGGFAIVTKKEKDPKHKDLFINVRYKKLIKPARLLKSWQHPSNPIKKAVRRRRADNDHRGK